MIRPSDSARPRNFAHFVLWSVSLPERIVRSAAGLAGLIGSGAARLLPRPVRETRFYRTLVTRYLRILSDDIGGAGRFPESQALDALTATRLGVGSMLDNLCILTLHASPLWILFAAQDVAKGARTLVSQIVDDLKAKGLVQEGSRLDNVDLLLEAVAKLSERTSTVIDMPPLKLDEIKQAMSEITHDLAPRPARPSSTSRSSTSSPRTSGSSRRSPRNRSLDVLTGLATQTAAKGGKLVLGTGQALATSIRLLGEQIGARSGLRRAPPGDDDQGLLVLDRGSLSHQLRLTQNQFVPERLTWTEIGLTFGKLAHAPWRVR